MKIIIDECLPKKLTQIFPDHEAWTVPEIGLAGSEDGKLLDELDARNIDVFITIDGNIEFQQRFIGRKFGTVLIRSVSNRLENLLHLQDELSDAIKKANSGNIQRVPDS